jgi:hypothetical protein
MAGQPRHPGNATAIANLIEPAKNACPLDL